VNRRQLVLGGLVLTVLVAAITTLLAQGSSASDRAAQRLVDLGPPLPGLSAVGRPVRSSPSCEAFRSCASATFTWPVDRRNPHFGSIVRLADQWARRVGLRDGEWLCGPQQGLFGQLATAGCVAGFDTTGGESVFLGLTFERSGYPAVLSTWPGSRSVPIAAPSRNAIVRTVSTQVVIGTGRYE
jgi:hypothetical protein